MKNSVKELNLNEMELANGGVIHMYFPIDKWEVIDDWTGGVLGTFDRPDLEAAKKYARELGMKDAIVYTSYVMDLRRRYEVYVWLRDCEATD